MCCGICVKCIAQYFMKLENEWRSLAQSKHIHIKWWKCCGHGQPTNNEQNACFSVQFSSCHGGTIVFRSGNDDCIPYYIICTNPYVTRAHTAFFTIIRIRKVAVFITSAHKTYSIKPYQHQYSHTHSHFSYFYRLFNSV